MALQHSFELKPCVITEANGHNDQQLQIIIKNCTCFVWLKVMHIN